MPDYFFELKERKIIAEDTMSFTLEIPKGIVFSFKAGQYADFSLENPSQTDSEGNIRSFSIVNSPKISGIITFATRMRNTAFKNELKIMPLQTKIKVTGPLGNFVLHNDSSKPAIFLCGGIGVTPARSIIETATLEKLPHKIFLFYSNKTLASTPFLDDFERFSRQNLNFGFFPTLTDSLSMPGWKHLIGKIDFEMIRKNSPTENAIFYISGPPEMVKAFKKMLADAKVNEDNIRIEEFAGY